MDIKQTVESIISLEELKYAPLLGALRLAATISRDVADASLGLATIEAINPEVAKSIRALQANAVSIIQKALNPEDSIPKKQP